MPLATRLPDPVLVTIDGVSIATYVLQPADPIGDVVFCHGTPWSAYVWARCAAHLSDRYRVFLWDMPGYGASAQEPDIVTLEPWGSPFFRLVAEHADVFAALPPKLHRALVTEYISGAAALPLADAYLEALRRPWLSDVGQAAFYDQIAQLRVADTRPVAERLHEVRCPTAIGWGEQDPWIPVDQAARLREAFPGSPELTVLPGVGHLPPLEDGVGVRVAMDRWLP